MFTDIKIVESSDTNVKKFVFTKDDAVAEAVLYKYPTYEDRTVMCISTQSGCPVGCRFCGAGDHFVRSLTSDEIVYQVTELLKHISDADGTSVSEIKKFQIMVMSMGEPLLNLKNLTSAFRTLNGIAPNARLLISSIGPVINYTPLLELSVEIPQIGLQFSVHESTDEARNNLIPFKAKLSLEGISAIGSIWWTKTGRKPFFNYCAHEGNSGAADADRLLSLFPPHIWEATISVICERDESIAAANERQRQLASNFMSLLMERGFSCRMFDPAGQDDIGGGCGQLWFVQDWMKNHPEMARPSIGSGMPVVHTPVISQS